MAIEIIIKNTDLGTNDSVSPQNPIQPNEQEANKDKMVSGKKDPGTAMMLNFLKGQAIAWAKAGVQSYTKYTGQGLLQERIDLGLQLVSDVGTIVAGGITAGPIGVAVATGMVAMSYAMKGFNQYMDLLTQNRELTFIRQRQGEIVVNGGRYGA